MVDLVHTSRLIPELVRMYHLESYGLAYALVLLDRCLQQGAVATEYLDGCIITCFHLSHKMLEDDHYWNVEVAAWMGGVGGLQALNRFEHHVLGRFLTSGASLHASLEDCQRCRALVQAHSARPMGTKLALGHAELQAAQANLKAAEAKAAEANLQLEMLRRQQQQ